MMEKELSAYHINVDGVLCYSGLGTSQDGIEFKHHNGTPFSKIYSGKTYEIWAINEWGLVHGIDKTKTNMVWMRINNCLRVFEY